MALDRKDVRFKVDADMHAAIATLAEVAQADIGEFIELIVTREVLRRVHDAKVIAERVPGLGISGKSRE